MVDEQKSPILDDENEILRESRFQEQCFLLDFYEEFVRGNKQIGSNGARVPKLYQNFVQLEGAPGTLMNKLLGVGSKEFFSIKEKDMAILQPKIRLFKTVFTKEGKKIDAEIKFKEFIDPADVTLITQGTRRRGGGVGLQKFEWEDMGTNPGDTGKAFASTLILHCSVIDDLFEEQPVYDDNGKRVGELSYADLIRTPPTKFLRNNIYNDKFFRIKVQIGWAVPSAAKRIMSQELINAINNTTVTLALNLTNHKIDFNQNGSIKLTIDYIGAIEGKLLSPEADIFYVERKVEQQIQNIKRLIESEGDRVKKLEQKVAAQGGRKGWFGKAAAFLGIGEISQEQMDLEDLEKSKEKRIQTKSNVIREDRSKAYKRFLSKLEKANRIFYVDVPKEQIQILGEINNQQLSRSATAELRAEKIKNFKQNSQRARFDIKSYSSTRPSALKQSLSRAMTIKNAEEREEFLGEIDKKLSRATSAKKEDVARVNFIYFGDVVNAALEVLYDRPETTTIDRRDGSDEFRFILGPIEIFDPVKQRKEIVSLADIPISLNLFNAWFLKKVIRPQLNKYLLRDFLRDACSELITAALSPACFGDAAKGRTNRVSFSVFSLPSNSNDILCPEATTTGRFGNRRMHIDSLNTSAIQRSSLNIKNVKNYMMLYVSGVFPDGLQGNYEQDTRSGIYHFHVGADRGLVKKISFERADVQYLKESRIHNSEDVQKGDLFLSEPYNATMNMVGNSIFKPGMALFIDPSSVGMGSSIPRHKRLPLGGYYNVTKVNGEIGPGLFNTSLKLTYVAPPKTENSKNPTPASTTSQNQYRSIGSTGR